MVSNFDIPSESRAKGRRAEYGTPVDSGKHSLNVRQNMRHQESLYQFAIFNCLGRDSLGEFLLDLACGTLLPFGGIDFRNRRPYCIGLDKHILQGGAYDLASCSSLVHSRFPLRDYSIDTLVSISFLQWVTATRDRGLMRAFAGECARVLSPKSGKAIFQFYPACKEELNEVCEAFAGAHPGIRGCRLSARPVKNRGIKLYIYILTT